jgi:hypothetical protein
MSLDLPITPGSDPLNGARIGKAAIAPQEEQTAKVEDVFEALLSSMDRDGNLQAEGSTQPLQQTLSQQQPDHRRAARTKPDAAQPDLISSRDPSLGSDLTPQRATGDMNWPPLYSSPLVQQPAVSATIKMDLGPAPNANATVESNSATYSLEISPRSAMRQSLKQVFAAAAGADSAFDASSEPDDRVVASGAPTRQASPVALEPPSQPVLQSPLQSAFEQPVAAQREQSLSSVIFNGEKSGSSKEAKTKSSATLPAKQDLPEPPSGSNSWSLSDVPASASLRRQNSPDNAPATEAAPETIENVTIHSLETYFPVVLSNMIAAGVSIASEPGQSAGGEQRSARIHIGPTSLVARATQQMAAPIKILTIQLEPESLGNVTVKMKMSRSNVDLHISVDSHDALRALGASHDKLVEAIQSTGYSVHSYTVETGAAAPASDTPQNPTAFGNQNLASSGPGVGSGRENIGREGAEHGGRSGNQQENPRDSKPRQTSDVASPRDADRVNGVYL